MVWGLRLVRRWPEDGLRIVWRQSEDGLEMVKDSVRTVWNFVWRWSQVSLTTAWGQIADCPEDRLRMVWSLSTVCRLPGVGSW